MRPNKYKERTRFMGITIPEDLEKKLRDEARELGKSLSEYVVSRILASDKEGAEDMLKLLDKHDAQTEDDSIFTAQLEAIKEEFIKHLIKRPHATKKVDGIVKNCYQGGADYVFAKTLHYLPLFEKEYLDAHKEYSLRRVKRRLELALTALLDMEEAKLNKV